MIEIVPVDTPSLGDRSYLVTDGAVGTVVDPQRDIDRFLALAAGRGVRITHVFETHLHNDYLTGGLALARATGAAYHVNAADRVAFDREPVTDGDLVDIGPSARIRVIATPGHTFTHLAYAAERCGRGRRRGVHRRLAAARVDRDGPTCSAPGTRPPWPRPSTPRSGGWPPRCPTRRWCYPRTGSAASARPAPASAGRRSTIGAGAARNPVLTLDEDAYVAGPAGRPG